MPRCGILLPSHPGMPFVYPGNDLSYTGNFLTCFFSPPRNRSTGPIRPSNGRSTFFSFCTRTTNKCSTNTIRGVGAHNRRSVLRPPAAIARYGPLHRRRQEKFSACLWKIARFRKFREFIKRVKTGEVKLHGLRHRVYKIMILAPASSSTSPTRCSTFMGKNPLLENRSGVRAHRPRRRVIL